MRRVLIIGGTGFIGSNLVKSIRKKFKDCQIYSLDNYISGTTLNHVEGVHYFRGNSWDIFEICNELENLEYIFHLGEYSRVENSFNEIDKVFELNLKGIHEVLRFSKLSRAKLIYAGSSTKFGDNGFTSSPYSLTKYINSLLVKNYCEWNKLNYAICYFYNAYGENENESGDFATVVGIFKKQYKENIPLTVVRPGTQRRNFTHINDIIDGLILVAKKGIGDDFGIGSDSDISILELAELFNHDVILIPERKGNRYSARLNTKKTLDLGWKPNFCINKHILTFIENNK